jgi:hypothetical protein
VYAVAHTLHEILLHHIQMQPMGKAKWMMFSPSQVMAFWLGVHNISTFWKNFTDKLSSLWYCL